MTRALIPLVLILVIAACGGASATTTAIVTESPPTTVAPSTEPASTTTTASTTLPPETTTTTTTAEPDLGYPEPSAGIVDRWVPEVRATYAHDSSAFTQGLLIAAGVFYESTGLYGDSSLRRVDVTTGEVIDEVPLGDDYFGEGIALVGGDLFQLTWQEGTAFTWDAATFEPGPTFTYEGEGWGLCDEGNRLVMTDGSASLEFRDPVTFEPIGEIAVTLEGAPVVRLNELECVGGLVFANVWQTTDIVVVDPATGEVTAVIDAAALDEWSQGNVNAVLNGIAYDAAQGVFYLTGKLWPTMYEVVFVAE